MDDTNLVDEVEVYRNFGGCLPIALANRWFFFKTLRQLNGQREEHANNLCSKREQIRSKKVEAA